MGFLAVFAFPPGIVILWIMYWIKDKDKATYKGIAKFILSGFLLIVPVLIIEILESLPWYDLLVKATLASEKDGNILNDIGIGEGFAFAFYFSFIVAALTEETAKFVCCFLLKNHEPTITMRYTVVILITSSALGFAMLENYGYILSSAATGNFLNTIIAVGSRAVLSVPLHAITGILIGCSIAKLHFETQNQITFKFYLSTIWLPILIHGLFDLFAIAGNLGGFWYVLYAVPVVLVIFGILLSYRRVKEVKELDLVEKSQVEIN